jgi:hypothetical protein
MAKVAQRQIVATVTPSEKQVDTVRNVPKWHDNRTYFAQVSGGEVQASVEKVYDGGSYSPQVLPAPIEVGDVTVTRHYDPDDDGGTLTAARQLVGKARYDVRVFTLDGDLNVLQGKARIYKNALLVNITEPEGDSATGGPATFSLTFACEGVEGVS